jgi:hypothetical protein
MAMMTAQKPAVREPMVARNPDARKRPRLKSGFKKRPRPEKCPQPKKRCGYERAGDLTALAARISTSIDWTLGDNALCLARQAGPGPRM